MEERDYRIRKRRKIKDFKFNTSPQEIRDIIKAWLVISVAFSIAISGFEASSRFVLVVVISGLTVGVAFILHELSHKIVAQSYGYWSEFRSFDQMLLLALLFSFWGLVFAAPGAVMISGKGKKDATGKISAAGPAINIFLASLFLVGLLFITSPVAREIFEYGFLINRGLALFNLIPVWMFDGRKIFEWNKFVWGSMFAVTIILLTM